MQAASTKKVAFIGLGAMGYPMAGHLQRHGLATTIYNRSSHKAQAWVAEYQGIAGTSPAVAARGADCVCLCVGNDDDVRAVVYGDDGVLASMHAGSVLVDHTTASAELARELAEVCLAKGIGFIDAPVSGGQAGAQAGQLAIMAGGEQNTFDQVQSIIGIYAKSCKLMGPAGAGQLTKMVNQICIAGVVQGLSEALHFAEQANLNIDDVMDVISKGAAQSWQMENRYQTMAAGKFDFGFAVDWMRKDLAIALKAADSFGASLPVTALVDQFYSDVQNMNGGRWDTSSLIQRLRRLTAD